MEATGAQLQPFLGIRFRLIGFDPETEAKVRSSLIKGGGVDAAISGQDCSHVIVGDLEYDDPVCVDGRNAGKTLVTSIWVNHSVEVGVAVDTKSIIYRPVRSLNGIPGSKNLILCLTGYQRQDREDIMVMTRLMGAQFSKPLVANKVTHLICYKFEGEKYELAKKLNRIKLVNHRWLQDCLKTWELLPEERYTTSGYELEIAETEAQDSDVEAELNQSVIGNNIHFSLRKEEQRAPAVSAEYKPRSLEHYNQIDKSPESVKISIESKDDFKASDSHTNHNNSKLDNVGKSPWRSPKPTKYGVSLRIPENSYKDDVKLAQGFISEKDGLKVASEMTSLIGSVSIKRDDEKQLSAPSFEKQEEKIVAVSSGQLSFKIPSPVTSLESCKGFSVPNSRKKVCAKRPTRSNQKGFLQLENKDDGKDESSSALLPQFDVTANLDTRVDEAAALEKNENEAQIDELNEAKAAIEGKSSDGDTEINAIIQSWLKKENDLSTKCGDIILADVPSVEKGGGSEINRENARKNRRSIQEEETVVITEKGNDFKNGSNVEESRSCKQEEENVLATKMGSSAKKSRTSKQKEGASSSARNVETIHSTKEGENVPSTKKGLNAKKSRAALSLTKAETIHSTKEGETVLSTEKGANDKKTRASTALSTARVETIEEGANVSPSKKGANAKRTRASAQKEEAALSTTKIDGTPPSTKDENVLYAKKGANCKKTKASAPKEEDENVLCAKKAANAKKTKTWEPKEEASLSTTKIESIQSTKEDENVSISNANNRRKTRSSIQKEEAHSAKDENVTSSEKRKRPHSTKEKENVSPAKRNKSRDTIKKETVPSTNALDVREANKVKRKRKKEETPSEEENKWFIVSGEKLQRKEYQQIIKRLKGKCCRDTHKWCYEATHFIAPEPLRRTEKFFAAAASGRWILKPAYIWACSEAGKLVDEEPFEWHGSGLTDDGAISLAAPRKWRLQRTGAFHGMRIAVYGQCIAPSLETLKRVVKSGGGTVVATCPPYTRFVKSGIDYAVVSQGTPRTDPCVQQFLANRIPCVLVDYLVDFVCKPGFPLDKHVLFDSSPMVN